MIRMGELSRRLAPPRRVRKFCESRFICLSERKFVSLERLFGYRARSTLSSVARDPILGQMTGSAGKGVLPIHKLNRFYGVDVIGHRRGRGPWFGTGRGA